MIRRSVSHRHSPLSIGVFNRVSLFPPRTSSNEVSQLYDALFSINIIFFVFFFSPVHSYSIRLKSSALSYRSEHDYCSCCLAVGESTLSKIAPCTFYTTRSTKHETRQYRTTECYSYYIVYIQSTQLYVPPHTQCVRLFCRIRRILGRHTKPTKLTSAEKTKKMNTSANWPGNKIYIIDSAQYPRAIFPFDEFVNEYSAIRFVLFLRCRLNLITWNRKKKIDFMSDYFNRIKFLFIKLSSRMQYQSTNFLAQTLSLLAESIHFPFQFIWWTNLCTRSAGTRSSSSLFYIIIAGQ